MSRIFNHVGHCVADLDTSLRFYTELMGFTQVMELEPPDEMTGKLLQLDSPGARVVYLKLDEFILELLHFGAGTEPTRRTAFNEAGLTHLSLNVDAAELDDFLARVGQLGGTVLDDTRLGDIAVMILDPDGLRIELTTGWTRPG